MAARRRYLEEQIEKAERLLRAVGDALTIERLKTFADECRREMSTLSVVIG